MSKIICDICGTTYQDTADTCPICGCPRDIAAQLAKEDFLLEDMSGTPAPKRKEIFDYDEVNLPASSQNPGQREHLEEEEDVEEETRQNTGAVILLTVLIVALLAAMGFLYWKFLRPDTPEETQPIPVYTQAVTEAPTTLPETTELRIPCQSLALSSGNAELSHEGQAFLLNVVRVPEDTTDELTFFSEDPSIATVDVDGRIVAVAQGETVVTILCGDQKLTCPVICAFETDEGETVPEETQETTVATEETKSVTLKLKKSEIRLPVYTYFTLVLDCDLTAEEVQWSSEHPYIATVDEKGVVTAIKTGVTQINVKYGDQEVSCIVRCYK